MNSANLPSRSPRWLPGRGLVPFAAAAFLLCGSFSSRAGEPLAVSIARNGTLEFLTVPGYTNYTVEWAPTVNGPWHRSWRGLEDLQPAGPRMVLDIPMFFRVVALGDELPVPPGMVHVGGGEFLMGDSFGVAANATPVRAVQVGAFFMDRFEVTRTLWDEVCAWGLTRGYDISAGVVAAAGDMPPGDLSWHDAVKWCNARSEMGGLTPAFYTDDAQAVVYRTGVIDLPNDAVDWDADGYRLPTEAEWEKAARGGPAGSHFPWPSAVPDYQVAIVGIQANYWNSGDPFDNGTTPVGYYDGHQAVNGVDMANGYGLYDTAGNVAEMCWDRFGAYDPGSVVDPHGPDTGGTRVLRGGSWYDNPNWLRCAARQFFAPATRGSHRGFRCVRIVPETP